MNLRNTIMSQRIFWRCTSIFTLFLLVKSRCIRKCCSELTLVSIFLENEVFKSTFSYITCYGNKTCDETQNLENFRKMRYTLKSIKIYLVYIININPTLHTKNKSSSKYMVR